MRNLKSNFFDDHGKRAQIIQFVHIQLPYYGAQLIAETRGVGLYCSMRQRQLCTMRSDLGNTVKRTTTHKRARSYTQNENVEQCTQLFEDEKYL